MHGFKENTRPYSKISLRECVGSALERTDDEENSL